MKFIYYIIIFVVIYNANFAATPVVKVPELESKANLELYEDNEGLFSIRVVGFYKMAVMLETQLKMMGVEPKTKVFAPTYDEFEELDQKIIRQYHKMAKSLEDEVIAAPISDRELLLNKINSLELALRDSVAEYIQQNGTNLNKFLDKSIKRLKAIDETYSSNLELVYQQFEDNCMNSPTLISVAGKGSIFFSNGGDNVRNDPFLSVKTTLNAGRIAGFWNDFNVWYEYLAPKFYTTYNRKDDYRDEWNMNAHAIGAGGKIPISVKPDFKHGINLELGYFWMRGNITNIPLGSVDWNGINFNFEYFAGVPNCRYPFELFLDFSIYHNFSKNLRFYTAVPHFEDVNIGKTHMAISIGVRYNLLTTPFVK